MSAGLFLAALVASCTPAPENPDDLAPAARSFFERMQARDYQGALNLVQPGAAYAEGDREGEATVEELLNQLGGSDNVSRLEVVDLFTARRHVVVHSRLTWPEDQVVDEQANVLSFEGGCISHIRHYG